MTTVAPVSVKDRQIVLDTETTGLEVRQGHRIIEIGCVELVNRRLTENNFHMYLNPERQVEEGAFSVHGLSDQFLSDKPLFKEVAEQFLAYISGAELVIHNAPFDVGFLNAELERLDYAVPKIEEVCTVHDTLAQARKLFPGQRNDLDSLCKRYEVSNDHRELHGALLDAEILADVYLAMTGGQTLLTLDAADKRRIGGSATKDVDLKSLDLPVRFADADELELHNEMVARLDDAVEGQSVFTKLAARN